MSTQRLSRVVTFAFRCASSELMVAFLKEQLNSTGQVVARLLLHAKL